MHTYLSTTEAIDKIRRMRPDNFSRRGAKEVVLFLEAEEQEVGPIPFDIGFICERFAEYSSYEDALAEVSSFLIVATFDGGIVIEILR